MTELLNNKWYQSFFKDKNLELEDLMNPFKANRTLFENEEEREQQKLQGRTCPFALSGSKAKQITDDGVARFKEVFLNKSTYFDTASKNRMKFGSLAEELVMTKIIPANFLDSTPEEKKFWQNKIIVLDKRRYSHPTYKWISVEFDALVFETKTTQDEETFIYNPVTKEDYELLDSNWVDGTWVPYMIMDLKITKASIEQNTKDYKKQLTLGCWMLPEFKRHSILGFIENASVDYWINNYEVSYAREMLEKYILYLDLMVIPALRDLDADPNLNGFSKEQFLEGYIKDYKTVMVNLKYSIEELGDENWDNIKKETIKELMAEALIYKKNYELEKLRFDLIAEKIKTMKIPTEEASSLTITTNDGRIAYSKFKRAGTETFKIKDYQNYLTKNNLHGSIVLIDEETKLVVEELPIEHFISVGEDSVTEFMRYTKTPQTKEEEKIIKLEFIG